MLKDSPLPMKILMLALFCGGCGLVLVGLIAQEPMAFKLAVADLVLFGGVMAIWRMKNRGGGNV